MNMSNFSDHELYAELEKFCGGKGSKRPGPCPTKHAHNAHIVYREITYFSDTALYNELERFCGGKGSKRPGPCPTKYHHNAHIVTEHNLAGAKARLEIAKKKGVGIEAAQAEHDQALQNHTNALAIAHQAGYTHTGQALSAAQAIKRYGKLTPASKPVEKPVAPEPSPVQKPEDNSKDPHELTQKEFYNHPRDWDFVQKLKGLPAIPSHPEDVEAEQKLNDAKRKAEESGLNHYDLDGLNPPPKTKAKQKLIDDYKKAKSEYGDVSDKYRRSYQDQLHKSAVEKALADGKHVHDRVLKDYPDLAAKHDITPSTATPAQTGKGEKNSATSVDNPSTASYNPDSGTKTDTVGEKLKMDLSKVHKEADGMTAKMSLSGSGGLQITVIGPDGKPNTRTSETSQPVSDDMAKRLKSMGRNPEDYRRIGDMTVRKSIADFNDSALASHQEEKAAEFTKNVPGLNELQKAHSDHEQYQFKWVKAMGNESQDGSFMPKQPESNIAELSAKYPRAALYLKAERMLHEAGGSMNTDKYRAAKEAMETLRSGGKIEDAQKELSDYQSGGSMWN